MCWYDGIFIIISCANCGHDQVSAYESKWLCNHDTILQLFFPPSFYTNMFFKGISRMKGMKSIYCNIDLHFYSENLCGIEAGTHISHKNNKVQQRHTKNYNITIIIPLDFALIHTKTPPESSINVLYIEIDYLLLGTHFKIHKFKYLFFRILNKWILYIIIIIIFVQVVYVRLKGTHSATDSKYDNNNNKNSFNIHFVQIFYS